MRLDMAGQERISKWELCKKFEFDYTNKWYMHNPATVLENETDKLLRDFDLQMDHLISARWTDHIIINKKWRTWRIFHFALPADHRVKLKESEENKYLDDATELKKNYGTWKGRLYQL